MILTSLAYSRVMERGIKKGTGLQGSVPFLCPEMGYSAVTRKNQGLPADGVKV
jgi:hypothetical protein